ncbi:MAG: PAS domain S-box protein [Coriobacteriia bacterium]|nr:PAS domain S-box protein [Coriobacteriia bacterium]
MAGRELLLRQMDDASFRANFEEAGVGMAQLDLDATIIRANHALCDMLGYSRKELVGHSLESITHPDDIAQSRVLRGELTSTPLHTLWIEKRYLRKNGSVVWANVSAALVEDDAGAPVYFIATVEDISDRKAAEAALRASEVKFSSMFNLAPNAMTIATLDGHIVDVNERFVEMFGFSKEEVLGHQISELGVWVDLADRQAILDAVAAGDVVRNMESLRRHKDGTLLPTLVCASGVEVDGEKFVLSISQDMTERKVVEDALGRSNERLQTLVDQAADGIFVTERTKRFSEANDAMCDMLGYSREELLSMAMSDTVSEEELARLPIQGDQIEPGGVLIFERRYLRKDGSAFIGEISLRKMSDGRFEGILRDLSVRGRAEQELRREQELYQATFDHAAIGIAQVTPEGRWLKVNQTLCDILGYSPEDFAHMSFADITHPDDVERTVDALQPLYDESHDTYRTEKRYLRKDRATVWADVSVAAIRNQDGSLAYLVTAVQDITERKRGEEDLRRSELRYRTIADNASDVVWILDPQTSRFTYVSPSIERQMGFTPAEVLADPMEALLTPQSGTAVHEALAKAMEDFLSGTVPEGQPYVIQAELVCKDAPPMWAEIVASLVVNQETGLVEVHGVTRDITERKAAETRLAKAFSSLIEVVGRVTEMRDPYTAGHQRRVAELSVAIAEQMGMPEAEIDEIRNAALVHDIGKMSIPAEILSKPGALLPMEFGLIQGHAKAGYDILEASDMPGQLAEIVYQHHERCDGSGYPRGLHGEDLLPQAKVIMVADVAEAMMSHRPYRAKLSVGAALDEIETGSGTKYSSEVAEACMELFRDGFTFADI